MNGPQDKNAAIDVHAAATTPGTQARGEAGHGEPGDGREEGPLPEPQQGAAGLEAAGEEPPPREGEREKPPAGVPAAEEQAVPVDEAEDTDETTEDTEDTDETTEDTGEEGRAAQEAGETSAGGSPEAPPAGEPPPEEPAGTAEPAPAPELPEEYASGRRFEDLPLSEPLLRGIRERGYTVATLVQARTIEPALAGRDLVVRAKTGTGKTAAFAIPILERIEEGLHRPQAIVLTPTRELAIQVAEEISALGRYKDLRVAVLYGGVAIGPQTEALQQGVDIVVGTPGRILDHIRRDNLDLSGCRIACLDEADEMLSMGFLEEVQHILDQIQGKPQVLLFSATVDKRVSLVIRRYTEEPESFLLSTDTDRVEGIRHVLYETTPNVHKARSLLAILDSEQPRSALIFCNTREDTATVASFLQRQGLPAQVLSGDLSQKKREAVMRRFKAGQVRFLVTTDVAARGIDVQDLSHVINYSLPEDPAIYLHRSGRTGRIGKKGVCISLAGGPDLNTRTALEQQYGITFEVRPIPSEEEAARLRLARQVKALERAMGTSAFEAYLPTVRALKERPDGDVLLAVALRTFFTLEQERMQRDDELGSVQAVQEARTGGGESSSPGSGSGRKRRRRRRPRKKRS